MKKLLVLAAITVLPLTASALSIRNTAHDLSSSSSATLKSTDTDRVCVFCHIPHNAVTTKKALWNRNDITDTGLAGWGTTTTLDGPTYVTDAIGAGSQACFSCHDGGVRVVEGVRRKPTTMVAAITVGATRITDASAMAGNHPVSIPYAEQSHLGVASQATIEAVAAATTAGIELENNVGVECTSCHQVHDNQLGSFLRVTTAGSALCFACHNK